MDYREGGVGRPKTQTAAETILRKTPRGHGPILGRLASADELDGTCDYAGIAAKRLSFGDHAHPYTDADIHHVVNVGNNPSYVYVLRNHEWKVG